MTDDTAFTRAAGEGRRRTMARIGHLIPRKQVEIERAVRLLRAHFISHRRRAPKRGTIHQIMLVGPYARPGDRPYREKGEINGYDLWAFVDHAAYKGKNRYWGLAQRAVAMALRGRAEITLSVFTIDEIDRLRQARNRFLTDQYDGGVILYDRAADSGVPPSGEDG
ncbi:hypothetical protein [Sphingomonas abietis]|uniref:Uncharacterized protein n=1 Tax=Sphingomonas abietis TaxID=3012344 RepID=A0ABY7NUM7_9SPHN|nr:hypothetical protein [Sphingomonas abietis]WBO24495.1 hypothetical protein PBT88_10525 [Sphingomonas abietis]